MSGDPFPPPSGWPARGLSLRPRNADDEAFLRDLYFDLRAAELASTRWPPGRRRAFTDSQFDLQDRHFRAQFPAADFLIIQRDERPIGRLYLNRGADGFLVVDIGLLSSARRRGLGRELLEHVQERAAEAGAPKVWLHVLHDNLGAATLYSQLGFQRVALSGAHWRMEWPTRRAAEAS